MAAVARKPVHFWVPTLYPSSYSNHSLLPAEAGRSIHAINTQTQKVSPCNGPDQLRERYGQFKSTAPTTFAHPRLQADADRDTAAGAEDRNRASTHSDDELDDEYLPSVKEILQTPFPTNTSTKPSKPERNQYLDKPAFDATGVHIGHTEPRLGNCQGGSHDQPVIIEDDESDSTNAEVEAETTTGADAESGSPERDTSLCRTGLTQDPTSESSAPVETSGPNIWYDIEDGRYVDEEELLSNLGLREQGGSTLLTSAQRHHRPLRQCREPARDQINEHNATRITQRTSEQPVTQSPLMPLHEGGDGWSEDAVAELEKEVELASEEQEKSSSTSSPSSPRPPHSIEPSHDEINRGSQSELIHRRSEERLRLLADRSKPASPDPGSNIPQASKLRMHTDITQESTSYDDLDVTKELEGEGLDVFAEGDDVDSRSKERTLSAVSDRNPASGSNISGLQDGQPDDTQPPQLALTTASPHQSGLKDDHLPKQLPRSATRNDRRKRPRTIAPIRRATTAGTAPAVPESADLEEAKSCVPLTAPDEEWELRDTDQKMVDDGSADGSDDEDYADVSDAAGSKRGGQPRPRKRVRWTKDTKDNGVEAPSTHSLDVSYQTAAATSPVGIHESEEMPIHGYFTLKTVASKVVYCLTFSQDLLPRPQHQGQRQDSTIDLEEPQSVAPVTDPNNLWGIHKITGRKIVDDEKHYKLRWEETWMPESELASAKELIDEFEAKLQHAQGGRGEGRQKRPRTEDYLVIGRPDTRDETVPKKRRGRPRKQK